MKSNSKNGFVHLNSLLLFTLVVGLTGCHSGSSKPNPRTLKAANQNQNDGKAQVVDPEQEKKDQALAQQKQAEELKKAQADEAAKKQAELEAQKKAQDEQNAASSSAKTAETKKAADEEKKRNEEAAKAAEGSKPAETSKKEDVKKEDETKKPEASAKTEWVGTTLEVKEDDVKVIKESTCGLKVNRGDQLFLELNMGGHIVQFEMAPQWLQADNKTIDRQVFPGAESKEEITRGKPGKLMSYIKDFNEAQKIATIGRQVYVSSDEKVGKDEIAEFIKKNEERMQKDTQFTGLTLSFDVLMLKLNDAGQIEAFSYQSKDVVNGSAKPGPGADKMTMDYKNKLRATCNGLK